MAPCVTPPLRLSQPPSFPSTTDSMTPLRSRLCPTIFNSCYLFVRAKVGSEPESNTTPTPKYSVRFACSASTRVCSPLLYFNWPEVFPCVRSHSPSYYDLSLPTQLPLFNLPIQLQLFNLLHCMLTSDHDHLASLLVPHAIATMYLITLLSYCLFGFYLGHIYLYCSLC